MLSGLIIYSNSDKDKNSWFIDKCIKKISAQGFSLIYKDEDDALNYAKTTHIDFAIYRSRNFDLVQQLESLGIKCFNNSLTNKVANNKYLSYQFFEEHKLPCLKSNLSSDKLSFPFVMKSVNGHGGTDVYLIHNECEISQNQKDGKKYIFQQYYENNGDLRLYVLNKKVIGAVLRKNNSDFRSNFSLGGKVEKYEPEEEIVNLAIKVAKLLDADYIGVDFLKVNGGWLINEIEDPVGSRMLYETSDIDAIGLFIKHIKEKMSK